MLNLFFSQRSRQLPESASFPSLGFSSLQMRMAYAYMWTTMLFMVTLLAMAVVLNWLVIWLPRHSTADHIWEWASIFLPGAAVMLGVALPVSALIGGFFGLLTSRKLARRLRNLAQATIAIAHGDYTLHIPIQRKDEVGILEEQFNRMAHRLAESQQREQELTAQNVRFQERTRLARELHDTISQHLFSLRLLAEGMHTTLPENSALREKLALFGRAAEFMTRDMRALLLELRPVQLEDLGLKEALEELAVIYSTRLNLTITTDIVRLSLPDKIEHVLFRIAQEAISNAVRHAQATSIRLTLASQQETAILSIQDNGKGFDPCAEEMHYGMGLRSMQERILELDGTIQLQSTPSQGTCISVYLPGKEKDTL